MNNLKKPELLCPVGGKLQLIAAVENGADAIYLGGAEFNARMYADNFDKIEFLEEAVDYCHLRNVRVYVTLNTLVSDKEIYRAIDYAKKLYQIGVDAVIVQDLGLIDRLSKEVPNLKIHVSTQATVYSKEGITFWDKYKNVDRIVLARELSLYEIENIVNDVDKEIEIFIHGALCVCYSGQCKLSSEIGARSGNRGKCAQPCRLPYRIIENSRKEYKEDYYLSTKDICTIDILPKIIRSGVHSLKIEGRMKSPEYVAAVTRIYRKYIDICYENKEYDVENEDKYELLQVFNRGEFSTGYLENKISKKLWCSIRPKHWGTYLGKVLEYNEKKNNIKIKLGQDIAIGDGIEVVNANLPGGIISYIRYKDARVKEAKKGDIVILGDIKGKIYEGQSVYKITSKKLNDKLKKYFDGKSIRKNNVDLKIIMRLGQKIKVNANCSILGKEFNIELEDGLECEKNINKILTKEEVINTFNKTGDVPFKINNIEVDLEENIFTAISNINYVRRKMFEILSDKIVKSFKHDDVEKIQLTKAIFTFIKDRNVDTKLSAYVYSFKLIDDIDVLAKFDRVCFSLEDVASYKEEILSKIDKEKIYIYLPTITTEVYKKYINDNISVIKEINNLVITNVEHIEMFKKYKLNLCAESSFNVFNSHSAEAIYSNNISTINLSNELTLEQINEIGILGSKEVEVDIYGNVPVMYSNFCPIAAGISSRNKCGACLKNSYSLKDRKNKVFPMLLNNIDCTVRILNSAKLFSKEGVKSLNNKVDYMRLYLYDESSYQIEELIKYIRDIVGNKNTEENKNFISNDKLQLTNGHFFREV